MLFTHMKEPDIEIVGESSGDFVAFQLHRYLEALALTRGGRNKPGG